MGIETIIEGVAVVLLVYLAGGYFNLSIRVKKLETDVGRRKGVHGNNQRTGD